MRELKPESQLLEETHRHPKQWWQERYNWIDEKGEPQKPEFKQCGRQVRSFQYMRDEFPEQEPNETTRLHCLQGQRKVTLHCVDLSEEDMSFPEIAKQFAPDAFLQTQREKVEHARLRVLL